MISAFENVKKGKFEKIPDLKFSRLESLPNLETRYIGKKFCYLLNGLLATTFVIYDFLKYLPIIY